MSRNMSNLDRGLRSFVIAPVAIVLAVVFGAGSIGLSALAAAAFSPRDSCTKRSAPRAVLAEPLRARMCSTSPVSALVARIG